MTRKYLHPIAYVSLPRCLNTSVARFGIYSQTRKMLGANSEMPLSACPTLPYAACAPQHVYRRFQSYMIISSAVKKERNREYAFVLIITVRVVLTTQKDLCLLILGPPRTIRLGTELPRTSPHIGSKYSAPYFQYSRIRVSKYVRYKYE